MRAQAGEGRVWEGAAAPSQELRAYRAHTRLRGARMCAARCSQGELERCGTPLSINIFAHGLLCAKIDPARWVCEGQARPSHCEV